MLAIDEARARARGIREDKAKAQRLRRDVARRMEELRAFCDQHQIDFRIVTESQEDRVNGKGTTATD